MAGSSGGIKVWYRFRGDDESTDFVEVLPDCDVASLRKVIFENNKESFTSLAPRQLKIYLNKDAFDKRSDGNPEHQALNPMRVIPENGTDEERMPIPFFVDYPEAKPIVLGLDAAVAIGEASLKRRFETHTYFNAGGKSTKGLSNGQKSAKRKRLGTCCVVCGADGASIAHILNTEEKCGRAGVEFDDSNFIMLCGSKGQRNTCHDAFDNQQMSFMHVSRADSTQWLVVGGGERHGKVVTIRSRPHRRVMHGHLTRAMITNALCVPSDYEPPSEGRISDSPLSTSQA